MSYYSTGSTINTHTCMFARCELPGTWYILIFVAYLRMFSGGELWATDEQARALLSILTLIGLRCWPVNPTIDQLPGRAVLIFSDNAMSLARFLFWTISHFFMYLGDYSPCVGNS